MVGEQPSPARDEQLSRLSHVYREMLADLQSRLGSNDNMVSKTSTVRTVCLYIVNHLLNFNTLPPFNHSELADAI